MPDRGRSEDRPARRVEFADGCAVEGVDGRHGRTIERGIEFAPFARRHDRARRQAQRRQKRADHHRIGRKHLAQEGDGGAIPAPALGRRNRARLRLGPGIGQHRPGQHILGFGMGGHTKSWHIDAHDPHAIDFLWQKPQWHAGSRGHAEVCHHDGIVAVGIGEQVNSFANILEQLAGDERFRN